MKNHYLIPILSLLILVSYEARAQESTAVTYTNEQQYLFNIFNTRRSVRQFLSTPIPKELIDKILEIAKSAPTAGNQQPWKFLVVRNREKLNELKQACITKNLEFYRNYKKMTEAEETDLKKKIDQNLSGYLSAPVYIVVLSDTTSPYPSYNIKDVSIAAGYLLIAARSLGYGSVFCTDSFNPEVVKKVFSIPDNYEVICSIPVGVPVKWPDSKPKKSLDEVVVYEKF
jgi:nitroreductase